MKQFCPHCKQEKEEEEFSPSSRGRNGFWCRVCTIGRVRAHRAKHPEHYRAYNRKRLLLIRYGLVDEEYVRMVDQQGGVCAICGLPPRGGHGSVLCVDHNHKNGKIRSLLCNECNKSLGGFLDSPEIILNAALYLMKWEEVHNEQSEAPGVSA